MTSKTTIKPLESVVSAIHCLKDKNGSSPQDIIKYLEGKYDIEQEQLKSHVQAGLKRGMSFGMVIQDAGLYRLNEMVKAPLDASNSKTDKNDPKNYKKHKKVKRQIVAKRELPNLKKRKQSGLRNRVSFFQKSENKKAGKTKRQIKKKILSAPLSRRRTGRIKGSGPKRQYSKRGKHGKSGKGGKSNDDNIKKTVSKCKCQRWHKSQIKKPRCKLLHTH